MPFSVSSIFVFFNEFSFIFCTNSLKEIPIFCKKGPISIYSYQLFYAKIGTFAKKITYYYSEDIYHIMKQIIAFIKKETVLTVAWILAVISAFWIHPTKEYIGYIDFKSLGILWSLMVIMAGLKGIGFFDKVGQKLLKKAKNSHQLTLILVFLCFFSSMFITNDVALITFVPFAIFMLEACNREDLLIPVIALQTLAANLGSMLMPIGNPQNLYLYGISKMKLSHFIIWMLPYSGITLLMLLISTFFIRDKFVPLDETANIKTAHLSRRQLCVYAILFILALLVVSRIVPYYYLAIAVLIAVFLMNKKVLLQIDYALLFTFVGFFIFTGNLGNMKTINHWLTKLVEGEEVITGVLASQVISNVPAALLLSEFTTDYKSLLIGVNLGGLGTLIASMASLISFKLLAHAHNERKGRYLLHFTWLNILYLIVLMGECFILLKF